MRRIRDRVRHWFRGWLQLSTFLGLAMIALVWGGLAQYDALANYQLAARSYSAVAALLTVGILIAVLLNVQRQRKMLDVTEQVRESQRALARSEQRYRLIVGSVTDGTWERDLRTDEVNLSPRWGAILGYDDAELPKTGAEFSALVHPDDRGAIAPALYAHLELNQPYELDYRLCRKNGEYRWVRSRAKAQRDADGRPTRLIGAITDITERKQSEAALTRANRELAEKQYAVDQAITISVTDTQGTITHVNDFFCRLSGYSRGELLGQRHRILNSGVHDAAFFADMYATIKDGRVWRGEICNRTKDGSLYWVDTTIVPQLDGDGRPAGYMAFRVDISARKQAEATIVHMANHDSLTGLGNRALLNEKLEAALANSRRCQESFAVLLFDLDGFKHVNDTLGHAAGDELLKRLAGRLRALLRQGDILARFGGDEFAIVQGSRPDPQEAAIGLAVKALEAASAPFTLAGQEIAIGTSIGIAIAPRDGVTPGELLQKADLALYRVKAEGRNNFHFFDEQLGNAAAARLRIFNDLRAGLARDEFELHYQPIVACKTHRLVGAEALVRWHHPSDGLLSPDRFIPFAEETGLIEPLGERILEKACAEAATWPDGIKVAVNLSAKQFRTGNLFDIVLCALVESGLPPERLELEITESVLLQDAAGNGGILRQLKNIGVSIVLDDFGTGYSSLSYLTKFPFDKIKIDKSFTQGLTSNASCAASIASILTLADALAMTVTAEGIETEQQFALLQASGVHQVQGYLFGRPCPASELVFSVSLRKRQAVEAA